MKDCPLCGGRLIRTDADWQNDEYIYLNLQCGTCGTLFDAKFDLNHMILIEEKRKVIKWY